MIAWGKVGDDYIVTQVGDEFVVEELVGAGNTYLAVGKFKSKHSAVIEALRLQGRDYVKRELKKAKGERR